MPRTGLSAEPARGLRRLDALPPSWAWSLGIGAGVLAGALLAGAAPLWIGASSVILLIASAAALAANGKPVALLEKASLVDLVLIPGGRFQMGSPEEEAGRYDNEGPVHEVWISPFACMRAPVTRRLYGEVMGADPGWPKGTADERPVNNVSWLDAIRFCNRLSKREGLPRCYHIHGEEVSWDITADGYRLLTEGEWEHACRAGTATRWSFGNDETLLGEHAWFALNSQGVPHPVGTRKPNPWGLYDMHGNVWEWCWDRYGPYSPRAETDPVGSEEGDYRVLRGGAFFDSPWILRCAFRLWLVPSDRLEKFGFRCGRGSRHQS